MELEISGGKLLHAAAVGFSNVHFEVGSGLVSFRLAIPKREVQFKNASFSKDLMVSTEQSHFSDRVRAMALTI